MTAKSKIGLLTTAFVLVVLLALTNPSEDQHLDQFVRAAQGWQSEHVLSCDLCDSVTDARELRLMAVSSFGSDRILVGGGLHRRNYIICSVLTNDGLADARTFGMLGLVLGPSFRFPFPCPKQNDFVIPEPRRASEFETTFTFSLFADGTFRHNGESVSQEELTSRLKAIANKRATRIVIQVDEQARHSQVVKVQHWVSSLGFETFYVKTFTSIPDAPSGMRNYRSEPPVMPTNADTHLRCVVHRAGVVEDPDFPAPAGEKLIGVEVRFESWRKYHSPDQVANASRACEVCDIRSRELRYCVESLVAAYAADGQFGKAVEWQKKAIELEAASGLATEKVTTELRSALELYKQGKPYRQRSGPGMADGVQ